MRVRVRVRKGRETDCTIAEIVCVCVRVGTHLELSPLVNGVDQCHRLPVRDLNTRENRRC